MKITIYQNREVYKEESKIGNDSENKVETLEFEFPEEYEDFTKYIEFQIKGGKYVDLIDNNKYVITREVAKYGKIKTQIVLKKNTENDVMVFKSDIFTLNVSNSINATENLVNTVGVDLIEKIVTKNNEQDTRLDILEADNATNKENISSIQDRQVTQDNRIDDLEADNTSNKSRITDIETKNVEQDNKIVSLESKNTEQDTNIQKNTADIKTINEKNKSQDTEITNIKSEQATQNTNIQTNTKSIEEINKKDSTQDNLIEELQTENTKLKKTIESMQIPGEATGNPIHLTDSSDLECEIAVVGNSEQETRQGYNLLDVLGNKSAGTTASSNGITYTINPNGSISVKGTATNNADYFIAGNWGLTTPLIELDGEYTSQLVDNTNASILMYLLNESTVIKGTTNHTTFTQTTNITGWFLRVNSGATVDTIIYPQLVKGTEIKPYEPYGAMPSPDYPSEIVTVGSNINLLENKAITQTINGVTFTVNKDGSIMVNGTATTNITFKINNDIVPKNISNLILSGCPNNGSKDTYDLKIELYKNGVWMKVLYDFGNGVNTEDLSEYTSCTISTTIRKDYNANNLIFKPKLEKGKVATPYSPYGQGSVEIKVDNGLETTDTNYQSYTKVLPIQKEFVKIGDVEDTFVKVDGKWYEKHCISKEIFNGAENWENQWSGDRFAWRLTLDNIKTTGSADDKGFVISNYFKLYTQNELYQKSEHYGICNRTNQEQIIIKNDDITSTADFKAYFAEKYANGTPVIVYYVLETPELIPCTAEQESILNSFYTYKGVTNVSMSGIGTLKVNYKKDLETIINKLSATSVAE